MKNKFITFLICITFLIWNTSNAEQFEFKVSNIQIIENNKIFALDGKAISKDNNLEILGDYL